MLVCAPLISWCLLRLVIVQSFGVVSFGGFNLVGIAGQFLSHEQVVQLPVDLQPLAQLALDNRDQLPASSLQMQDEDKLNYLRIENNYDVTIWSIFTPAAREIYGNDARTVNTQLRKLATAILKITPRHYAVWLAKSFRHGIYKIVSDFVLNPFGLLITAIAAGATIVKLAIRWRQRTLGVPSTIVPVTEILFVMTFFYTLLNLLETILVCPPLGRMTDAAAIMLTPLVASLMSQQFTTQAQTGTLPGEHNERLEQIEL